VRRRGVDIRTVYYDETALIDAQADGLACIYCGRSGRSDGSLTPLRPAVRPASRSKCSPVLVAIGHSLDSIHVSRCEPPCPDALAAYCESFETDGPLAAHGRAASRPALRLVTDGDAG